MFYTDDDTEQEFYDPTDVGQCPSSALTARARYFWGQMAEDQQQYAKLVSEAALSPQQASKLMGKEVPECALRSQYVEIKMELLLRSPTVDPVDLLQLYAKLHDKAAAKNQIANAKNCLDAIAKLSGADQVRLEARLPTDVGAEEMSLRIVGQIANGDLSIADGTRLLQAIEVGAKLSLTQRAIDSAPGATTDPLQIHKPGTEAWLNARKFAENLALLRAVDASPLTLVGDNNDD